MSVYRIVDKNEPSMFYIGSTKDLNHRIKSHKFDCKTMDRKVYKYIRENGGWDNFEFEVIEKYDNYKEKEIEIIQELQPPLNMNLYNYDINEYAKAYRNKNKEKIAVYYEANKKQILEQRKVRIVCDCGTSIRKWCLARHIKTKKHQRLMSIRP